MSTCRLQRLGGQLPAVANLKARPVPLRALWRVQREPIDDLIPCAGLFEMASDQEHFVDRHGERLFGIGKAAAFHPGDCLPDLFRELAGRHIARVAQSTERDVWLERFFFNWELHLVKGVAELVVERFEEMRWSPQAEPEHPGPVQLWEHPESRRPKIERPMFGDHGRQHHPQNADLLGRCVTDEVQRQVGSFRIDPSHRPVMRLERRDDGVDPLDHRSRQRHGEEDAPVSIDRFRGWALLLELGTFPACLFGGGGSFLFCHDVEYTRCIPIGVIPWGYVTSWQGQSAGGWSVGLSVVLYG